jgi:RNA-directed DNA polymerase
MAWEHVRRAGGGCGVDGKTIPMVEEDLENQLYKIWNRLSSGSYMAEPVKLVQIPKAGGKGQRTLGVPNVTDRVAQMVIKTRLEPFLEPHFHPDSYAYRPGRAALDAVGMVRERCFQYNWVIDLDIRGFFDTLDHELLMDMVCTKTEDRTIHLYAERFLKAKGQTKDGETIERTSGTSQGGVVSPLLANLYLHEAFDQWMYRRFPEIRWARFADDIIVHCTTEHQACELLERIKERLAKYKLQVHEDKTRIVYTGRDSKGPRAKVPRSFTYLGYEFKPREYRWAGVLCLVFTPAMGQKA